MFNKFKKKVAKPSVSTQSGKPNTKNVKHSSNVVSGYASFTGDDGPQQARNPSFKTFVEEDYDPPAGIRDSEPVRDNDSINVATLGVRHKDPNNAHQLNSVPIIELTPVKRRQKNANNENGSKKVGPPPPKRMSSLFPGTEDEDDENYVKDQPEDFYNSNNSSQNGSPKKTIAGGNIIIMGGTESTASDKVIAGNALQMENGGAKSLRDVMKKAKENTRKSIITETDNAHFLFTPVSNRTSNVPKEFGLLDYPPPYSEYEQEKRGEDTENNAIDSPRDKVTPESKDRATGSPEHSYLVESILDETLEKGYPHQTSPNIGTTSFSTFRAEEQSSEVNLQPSHRNGDIIFAGNLQSKFDDPPKIFGSLDDLDHILEDFETENAQNVSDTDMESNMDSGYCAEPPLDTQRFPVTHIRYTETFPDTEINANGASKTRTPAKYQDNGHHRGVTLNDWETAIDEMGYGMTDKWQTIPEEDQSDSLPDELPQDCKEETEINFYPQTDISRQGVMDLKPVPDMNESQNISDIDVYIVSEAKSEKESFNFNSSSEEKASDKKVEMLAGVPKNKDIDKVDNYVNPNFKIVTGQEKLDTAIIKASNVAVGELKKRFEKQSKEKTPTPKPPPRKKRGQKATVSTPTGTKPTASTNIGTKPTVPPKSPHLLKQLSIEKNGQNHVVEESQNIDNQEFVRSNHLKVDESHEQPSQIQPASESKHFKIIGGIPTPFHSALHSNDNPGQNDLKSEQENRKQEPLPNKTTERPIDSFNQNLSLHHTQADVDTGEHYVDTNVWTDTQTQPQPLRVYHIGSHEDLNNDDPEIHLIHDIDTNDHEEIEDNIRNDEMQSEQGVEADVVIETMVTSKRKDLDPDSSSDNMTYVQNESAYVHKKKSKMPKSKLQSKLLSELTQKISRSGSSVSDNHIIDTTIQTQHFDKNWKIGQENDQPQDNIELVSNKTIIKMQGSPSHSTSSPLNDTVQSGRTFPGLRYSPTISGSIPVVYQDTNTMAQLDSHMSSSLPILDDDNTFGMSFTPSYEALMKTKNNSNHKEHNEGQHEEEFSTPLTMEDKYKSKSLPGLIDSTGHQVLVEEDYGTSKPTAKMTGGGFSFYDIPPPLSDSDEDLDEELDNNASIPGGNKGWRVKDVTKWSTRDVAEWCHCGGFNELAELFRESTIDGRSLLDITRQDLEDLDIQDPEIQHGFLKSIDALKRKSTSSSIRQLRKTSMRRKSLEKSSDLLKDRLYNLETLNKQQQNRIYHSMQELRMQQGKSLALLEGFPESSVADSLKEELMEQQRTNEILERIAANQDVESILEQLKAERKRNIELLKGLEKGTLSSFDTEMSNQDENSRTNSKKSTSTKVSQNSSSSFGQPIADEDIKMEPITSEDTNIPPPSDFSETTSLVRNPSINTQNSSTTIESLVVHRNNKNHPDIVPPSDQISMDIPDPEQRQNNMQIYTISNPIGGNLDKQMSASADGLDYNGQNRHSFRHKKETKSTTGEVFEQAYYSDCEDYSLLPLSKWRTADVLDWLKRVELGHFAETFAEHHVMGRDLARINLHLLDKLGVHDIHDRELILSKLYKLQNPSGPSLEEIITPGGSPRHYQTNNLDKDSNHESNHPYGSSPKSKGAQRKPPRKQKDAGYIHIWHNLTGKHASTTLHVDSTLSGDDVIQELFETLDVEDSPKSYCIVQRSANAKQKSRILRGQDCPLQVQRQWSKTTAHKFELQKQKKYSIKVVNRVMGSDQTVQTVNISATTTCRQLLQHVVKSFGFGHGWSSYYLVDFDHRTNDIQVIDVDQLICKLTIKSLLLCDDASLGNLGSSNTSLMAVDAAKLYNENTPTKSSSPKSSSAKRANLHKDSHFVEEKSKRHQYVTPKKQALPGSLHYNTEEVDTLELLQEISLLKESITERDSTILALTRENERLQEKAKQSLSLQKRIADLEVRYTEQENYWHQRVKDLHEEIEIQSKYDSAGNDLPYRIEIMEKQLNKFSTDVMEQEKETQNIQALLKHAENSHRSDAEKSTNDLDLRQQLSMSEDRLLELKHKHANLFSQLELARHELEKYEASFKGFGRDTPCLYDHLNDLGPQCILCVNVSRSPGSLGFMVGRNGHNKLVIKHVEKGLKLKKGDRLLEINGQNVSLMSESQVQKVLEKDKTLLDIVVLRDIQPIKETYTDNEEIVSLKEDLSLALMEAEALSQDNRDLANEIQRVKEDKIQAKQEKKILEERVTQLKTKVEVSETQWLAVRSLLATTKHGRKYIKRGRDPNILRHEDVLKTLNHFILESNQQKDYLDQMLTVVIDKEPDLLEDVDKQVGVDEDDVSMKPYSMEYC